MSDQTSIFGNQSPEPTTQVQQTTQSPGTTQPFSQSDPMKDLLAQIKNEKGEPKYKTIEDALNGLLHAQNHIATLVQEKRQVETEINELRPVAEQVKELRQVVERLTQPSTSQEQTVQVQGLTEEQVANLVQAQLTKSQQQQVSKQNLEAVVATVKAKFGEKAEQEFYGRAKELGMSVEEVNALAARTPKAALRMLGIEDTQQVRTGTPAPTGSINTTALSPNTSSFIGRNSRKLEVGATSQDLMEEAAAARKMVDELQQKNMTIEDLTKPSNYFKYFR